MSGNFLPQFLVAVAANGGAFIFGTLLGWSAPTAHQIIEEEDFYFFVTGFQFAWIVALMALGAAISSLFCGILWSKLGTRLTIFFFGIPIVIGWVMIIIPINPAMLMIGRLLCGLAVGCYCCIVPIYVGEIATNELRGAMLSIFQLSLNIGILFVFTVGHFASLRVLNIVCGCIPVVYSIGFLLLPESPSVLIRMNGNARKSLEKLRGKSHDIDSEMKSLQWEHEELKRQEKSFGEVFKTRSTTKALVIILLQFFFLQMSGINIVSFYSTMIFFEAGLTIEAGIASIIIASVPVITNLVAAAFVDRFGRKILLYVSNVGMIVGLSGIGTFFLLRDAGNNVDNLGWLPVVSLSFFVIAFSVGMGPITYILFGELFMQDAKVFVAPITQTFNFIITFVVGLTFPLVTSTIGMGPTFFIFAGFCGLALLFAVFVIPETKGRSTTEIQDLLS